MGTDQLRGAFPDSLQENAPLARYTATRIGGSAEFLLTVHSAAELASAAEKLWELKIEFQLLGGGSNVLVADRGISGVVILNQASGDGEPDELVEYAADSPDAYGIPAFHVTRVMAQDILSRGGGGSLEELQDKMDAGRYVSTALS